MAPVLVFLGLYASANFASRWAFGSFWASKAELTGDPPWYFIGQDFVNGLVSFVALILALLMAFWTRRRYAMGSWMAAWMGVLWLGYPAAQMCHILLRTTHIWDPGAAVSRWRTFGDYARDPFRDVVFGLSIAIALGFALWSRKLFASRTTEDTPR
jgi:hypothetical protein